MFTTPLAHWKHSLAQVLQQQKKRVFGKVVQYNVELWRYTQLSETNDRGEVHITVYSA